MYVLNCIFYVSFDVCRTQSWLSLLILTALRRKTTMFRWKTVGMLVRSFSYLLPASNGWDSVRNSQRMHPTDVALMTSVNCPSDGRWSVLG